MEIILGIIIIAMIVLIGIYVVPGIYWLLAHISFYFFYTLDDFFSANFFTGIPWFGWGIAGGLIGAAVVFLSVASRYGMRKRKFLILLAPFVIIAIIRWLFSLFTLITSGRG